VWAPNVTPLLAETVAALDDAGVVLVGTDAPSVDPVDSTALPAHHALCDAGIVNLENLALADVPPGRYELMALPLRILGADAAPVRAVLRVL
jgi:arylformamidase